MENRKGKVKKIKHFLKKSQEKETRKVKRAPYSSPNVNQCNG